MDRKERRRNTRAKVREAMAQAKPKIRVKAMDVFREESAHAQRVVRGMRTADGYDNPVSRIGLQQNNALSAGTYEFDLITRNRVLLEMSYRGSWMVGQVIDCVAEDMTRAGVTFTTSQAEKNLAEYNAAYTRLSIFDSLCNGTKWGRLYGGGIGVMDIAGQDTRTPLNIATVGRGQFKGLMIYDRWMLNPLMTPIIPNGPDAGLPMYYQIVSSLQAYDPESDPETGDNIVHHSRIFRFGGIKLPFYQAITEQMWDESVLERLWDRLIAFDNATMSTGSLIDRANLRTVKIQDLREIAAAGGEAYEGLQAQFEMMRLAQVNEGLTLLDKNDEFNSTAYSFTGLSDVLLQFGQQLSGASQIPLVRLFGQSPAGLSATGDAEIRMYYDKIKAQQEATFRKPFTKLARVMWRSEFGTAAPRDLEFQFTPLWQMDAKDKAEIGKTNTDSISEAHQQGLLTTPAAMKELRSLSPATGLYTNISDEDIEEAELEPAPLPDLSAPGSADPNAKNTEGAEPVREPVQEKPAKTGDGKLRGYWKWIAQSIG